MVVAAPPAVMIPRSARIQSRRVDDKSATRCSSSRPTARKPQAMARTLSPASRQVTGTKTSPRGYEKACAWGVAATRSRNNVASDEALIGCILPNGVLWKFQVVPVGHKGLDVEHAFERIDSRVDWSHPPALAAGDRPVDHAARV